MFYSNSTFLLQLLSHFFRFCQTFFRFYHTLQWLSHFLLQWLKYFCYNASSFVIHFLDFVVHYSDSTIFAIMVQTFFIFHQPFLRFRPHDTMTLPFCYSDSIILRFHQLFFVISSVILRFRRELQWLGHFAIVTRPFSDFVMSHCSDSAIFWFISYSWDMVSHFSDFIWHSPDFTQSFLGFTQSFVSSLTCSLNPYCTSTSYSGVKNRAQQQTGSWARMYM
jgi:hypothetical protein